MNSVVYSTKGSGGEPQVIMELWIEGLRVCINETGGAFASAKPRSPINHFGTFDVPDSLCRTIQEYVEKKTAFDKVNKKIFAALKQRLVHKKTQHNRIVPKRSS